MVNVSAQCPQCFSNNTQSLEPTLSLCLECGCYIPHPLNQDFPNTINVLRFPKGVTYSLEEVLELEGINGKMS
jgi:hypothetical protein